jgi:hypothetical protein
MMAHACILEAELAAATARIAELEAAIYTDSSAVVARLEAENKRLREPMPLESALELGQEWFKSGGGSYSLICRVEDWHANK